MRDHEIELASSNPHLAQALAREKMEGHRLAVVTRTIAMVIIAILLPFINPNWHVLFYEVIILMFIGLGWLQYKYAQVGYSKAELALILADIILLTVIFLVPNPFHDDVFPTAMLYRFDNFNYFFVILAVASLAYSWRTVWSIGTWVAGIWLLGYVGMRIFGTEIPELDQANQIAYGAYPLVEDVLRPNSAQLNVRIQEIVVFLLVAGILAVKGSRSNQLLMRQAAIAEERANLSRYFPSSLVDSIASTNRDIRAVRSQQVAVLFTDIVGFTQYAERNTPENVMDLLRNYHALVERAIFENSGTLEKYMGDGVMATFGRPETSEQDTRNALQCANAIITANTEFNQLREEEGKESVRISIGIHYGEVILGDIGPERRLEFAVVGDTVNVAARLEAQTRNLECQCIVSETVIENLPERGADYTSHFKKYGDLRLRGRNQPISVWVS